MPVIALDMNTIGTSKMAGAFHGFSLSTVIHKHILSKERLAFVKENLMTRECCRVQA